MKSFSSDGFFYDKILQSLVGGSVYCLFYASVGEHETW